MGFFCCLEEAIDARCEKYSHRSPVFIEVSGTKLPLTQIGSRDSGPIPLERIPAALDAAGVGTLLVPVLWSTDEVRARVKAAIAVQWGLGDDWKAIEGVLAPAVGGRIEVVFLHGKSSALGHGGRTSAERERDLTQMLAPTPARTRSSRICETDWAPEALVPERRSPRGGRDRGRQVALQA
ncbi:hypothetical protein [Streptomyces griseoaurantiacus]|uniref:hypothetical protein n=1 Tax=Streptomyces griseoaurantiacus TaxID=68213 RepID=UPI0037A3C977